MLLKITLIKLLWCAYIQNCYAKHETNLKNYNQYNQTDAKNNAYLVQTNIWLERFSEHLHKAFAEYSHVNVFRKALKDVKRPLKQDNVQEFMDKSQLTVLKLNNFFGTKIAAIMKIKSCDSLLRAINQTAFDNKEFLPNYLDSGNINAIKNKQTIESISTVHVALNEYKCGKSVLEDYNWTNDDKINKIWHENAIRDPTIKRQYFGTFSGLTRIYPRFKWHGTTEPHTIDLFDPRFRPWFVAAETAPKDVLFLIDYSGSVRGVTLHIIKTLIQHILGTLTSNDFFTGVWYNSKRDLVLTDCFSKDGITFLPAISRNKQLFQRYLDRIEEKDQAVLPLALNFSFNQFLQNSNLMQILRHGADKQWKKGTRYLSLDNCDL